MIEIDIDCSDNEIEITNISEPSIFNANMYRNLIFFDSVAMPILIKIKKTMNYISTLLEPYPVCYLRRKEESYFLDRYSTKEIINNFIKIILNNFRKK